MTRRTERVNDLLQEELSQMLREDVKDPRISHGLLSITEVVVSPDMRHATVYVSHLGSETERKEVMEGLAHVAPFLRSELVRRLKMKRIPAVHFRLDPSLERGARLAALINEVSHSTGA